VELIPAIDLRGGRVVRLRQGDFEQETRYGDDPVAVARRWVREGASRLHLVDLDGAIEGRPAQASVVGAIASAVGVPCQVGGGLRDEAAVAGALAVVDRAILGTALLDHPALGTRLVERFGAGRIGAAVDVRAGRAARIGWQPGAEGGGALDAVRAVTVAGVRVVLLTAIDRDGTLEGPDLELVRSVRAAIPGLTLIASGGIGTLEDLRALADLGCDGAILGRALYEGRFTLPEALASVA
jgi:phosphoribosylformimino-5-aminoimidazole carboxamide ribotide isomerase